MPASIDAAINLDDLRKLAKRRLPKLCYDFIEGGLDDEVGVARNEDAFRQYPLGAALRHRRHHPGPEHDLCSAGPTRAPSGSRRPGARASSGAAAT